MPQANVVHLLQQWGEESPPADLRIGGAMKPGVRAGLAAALTVESVVTCALVRVLWTAETPGWWFSLLFTVFLVGISVALWAGYASAIRTGNERALAQSQWTEWLGTARATAGTVIAREVATIEDGSVSSMELTVMAGSQLSGTWRRRTDSARMLLQAQVPGVGAAVRVWSAAGAPAGCPSVIEVLDPTVVQGTAGLEKYAG